MSNTPRRAHATALLVSAALLAAAAYAQPGTLTLDACTDDTRPLALLAADFDGDGHPGLAVGCSPRDTAASSGPGHVEVHLGAGDSTFEAPRVILDTEYGVTALAWGDLNQDGAPDLLIGVAGPHERTLVVLAGDGAGRFEESGRHATGFTISRPAVVDATGDGVPDVAMPAQNALYHAQGPEAAPEAWRRTNLVGMDERYDVHLADVDMDRRPDVAHVQPSAGKIRLWATDPDTPEEIVLGKAVREVIGVLGGGDLNGDGTLDLGVASPVDPYAAEVRLALSDGNGAWSLGEPLPSLGDPMEVLMGDVSGDGHADLVAAPRADPDADGYAVRVALGRGDGTFAEAQDVPVSSYPYRPLLHDLSGDGTLDLAHIVEPPEPGIAVLWGPLVE